MSTDWFGKCPPRQAGEDAATYIASVSAELSALARRQGYGTLAYILDMARLEAEQQSARRRQ